MPQMQERGQCSRALGAPALEERRTMISGMGGEEVEDAEYSSTCTSLALGGAASGTLRRRNSPVRDAVVRAEVVDGQPRKERPSLPGGGEKGRSEAAGVFRKGLSQSHPLCSGTPRPRSPGEGARAREGPEGSRCRRPVRGRGRPACFGPVPGYRDRLCLGASWGLLRNTACRTLSVCSLHLKELCPS